MLARNVATEECVVPSSPIGHLLRLQTNDDGTKSSTSIVSVSILLSGMPVFTTSAEETFTYHAKLKTWMRVGDSQSVKFQLGKGITGSLIMMEQTYGNLLSLTQIENFMACALQLESLKEYRYWLKVYARRLSDENSSGKIEELCYLLLGTHSGSSQGKNWDPLILVNAMCFVCPYS